MTYADFCAQNPRHAPVVVGEKFKKDDVEYEITGYALKDNMFGRTEMVYFINTKQLSRAIADSECMMLDTFLKEFGQCLPSRRRLMEDLRREKELAKQNTELQYTLWGVMHSVDKWLDGDELKQPEVQRAAIMREKTLQVVEQLQAEIEKLKSKIKELAK